MQTAEQVQVVIDRLKADGVPLSDAVWETALACVGWPYVFGAWGEECTPANRKRRARDEHPTVVSKCQVLSGKKSACNGCKWYPDGHRVRMFDCRGFTDWVLKNFGIDLAGEGATSQWNTASNWAAKGTIDTVPEDTLVCLFIKDGKSMSHTGFGFKGQTCECSNGVQHFTKRDKKWTHWAIPRGIDGEMPDVRKTLRKGSTGPDVVECQTDLIRLGYDIGPKGADGVYGAKTVAAVKVFQADNGLTADGICGPKTWEALKSAGAVKYTVTIQHIGQAVADEILKKYGGTVIREN